MSAARRSRLWRHTLGPLVALVLAVWLLSAAADSLALSAWLVVR